MVSVVLFLWEVAVVLIALAKSRSAKGASQQPVFMGSCLGISHMHFPCLPSGRINNKMPELKSVLTGLGRVA